MKPAPKVSLKKQDLEMTDKEKIAALEAEILRLHRKIAKDYASHISTQQQVRALQENLDKQIHSSTPLFSSRAIELLDMIEKDVAAKKKP